MSLTLDLIRDAQSNGLAGTGAVLEAMDDRLTSLANAAARRMTQNGHRFEDYREDFRQDAVVAMFEALPRFDGSSVDNFYAFMWSTIENELKDRVRAQRNEGADKDALKIFGAMLTLTDGDLVLAERLACTLPPKGRRLSADRAHAARLSWLGPLSLEAPALAHEGPSAGSVSQGDFTAICSLGEGLASTLGIPEELITAGDLNKEANRRKTALVHGILDTMGEAQRTVLKHSFGIGDVTYYGHGDSGDDEGLAAEIGSTVVKVRDARTKGLKSFAKRYVKAVATSDAEAQELTEAAAANLGYGGRK